MLLSEFDYHLPDELIAQVPLEDRASSRMMVIHRDKGTWEDRTFVDFAEYVGPGDCVVINDTSVFPARLLGRKPDYDRTVEVFLLKPVSDDRKLWNVLVRPGRHLHEGARVEFSESLYCDILEAGARGERVVQFTCTGDVDAGLERAGHVPLPPYIHRSDETLDRERYQTVYAEKKGSVAAPTAGLHFTPEILDACKAKGAEIARVTLHVGLGTFQPLPNDEIEANHLHPETYQIGADAAAKIREAKRVVAVGTTSVRVLETAAGGEGLAAQEGETSIFIYPGYEFKATGALLTNFHLPKSSLVLLASAFTGKDLLRAAYDHAVEERYRFFSYGDCMLVL